MLLVQGARYPEDLKILLDLKASINLKQMMAGEDGVQILHQPVVASPGFQLGGPARTLPLFEPEKPGRFQLIRPSAVGALFPPKNPDRRSVISLSRTKGVTLSLSPSEI